MFRRAYHEPSLDEIRAHFTPGNIVTLSFWGTHDRVLAFTTLPPEDGDWTVTVEEVRLDPSGAWVAIAPPRTHCTVPDLTRDRVVARV